MKRDRISLGNFSTANKEIGPAVAKEWPVNREYESVAIPSRK